LVTKEKVPNENHEFSYLATFGKTGFEKVDLKEVKIPDGNKYLRSL